MLAVLVSLLVGVLPALAGDRGNGHGNGHANGQGAPVAAAPVAPQGATPPAPGPPAASTVPAPPQAARGPKSGRGPKADQAPQPGPAPANGPAPSAPADAGAPAPAAAQDDHGAQGDRGAKDDHGGKGRQDGDHDAQPDQGAPAARAPKADDGPQATGEGAKADGGPKAAHGSKAGGGPKAAHRSKADVGPKPDDGPKAGHGWGRADQGAGSSTSAAEFSTAPTKAAGAGHKKTRGPARAQTRARTRAIAAPAPAPVAPAPAAGIPAAPAALPVAPAATVPSPPRRSTAPARDATGTVVRHRRATVRRRAARRIAAVQAPARWVPAAAPAVTSTASPAPATTPETTRPERKDRADHHGGVRFVPIFLNALSDTAAFVPLGVWVALGALLLVALAMAALAFARDRRARALGRERTALVADLEALEGAVVPALPDALGGLALSVTSSPAARPAGAADFHDAFPLSHDRVAVLVGDVAGTGRRAMTDALLVRHAVRAYLEAGLDPRAAIAMTGAVVDERDESLFASVLVVVHDRRNGTLTFATAGHEPPILVSEQGAVLPPVSGWSPPLGTGLETGRRQTSLPLPQGSAVCLLTDGVTEARSDGERLGVSRVIAWLSALGPGAMASDIVARVRAEADDASEDVTVCMLRALTPAAADVPRIEEAIVEGGDPTYLVHFLRDCGLPVADAQEAGAALAAMPDGARMVASVEIRGGRAVVELAPLRGATTTELIVG